MTDDEMEKAETNIPTSMTLAPSVSVAYNDSIGEIACDAEVIRNAPRQIPLSGVITLLISCIPYDKLGHPTQV